MVGVLEEVEDWEMLALQLNITRADTNKIKTGCQGLSSCYRMVVTKFCDLKKSASVEDIVIPIVEALREIGHTWQGEKLINEFIRGKTMLNYSTSLEEETIIRRG